MASVLWNFLVFGNFVEVPLKAIQHLQDTKFLKCFYLDFLQEDFSLYKDFFFFFFQMFLYFLVALCPKMLTGSKMQKHFQIFIDFSRFL